MDKMDVDKSSKEDLSDAVSLWKNFKNFIKRTFN